MTTPAERAALRYDAIETLLREVGEPMAAQNIYAAIPLPDVDWNWERCRQDLRMMERKGRVFHPAKGLWAIVDRGGKT